MMGLEDRLRKVPGVADLTLELGNTGVDGLRVRIDAGADEAVVLDEIRRLLVAYGLTSRSEATGGRRRALPQLDSEVASSAGESRLFVGPHGDGIEVVLTVDGRSLVAHGERSPVGAATAMTEVVTGLLDRPMPRRVGIAWDQIEGFDVVTVLVRSGDVAGVGAALVSPSLAVGLFRAVRAAVVSAPRL